MDAIMLDALETNISLSVPWFLMASWLYYHAEISLLSDYAFDHLCETMLNNWSDIKHHHKHIINKDDLAAGTGFSIPDHKYPQRIKSAALLLHQEKGN